MGQRGMRQGDMGEGGEGERVLTSWALRTLFAMSRMSSESFSGFVLVVSSDPQTLNMLL